MTRKPRWQQEDPRFREESARYANPIPSRELLLAKLAEAGKPLAFDALAGGLGIEEAGARQALLKRLGAMAREGELLVNRAHEYCLVDRLSLVVGTVSGHRDGFGFLVPDDGGDDLFLPYREMRMLFHGDRAAARVTGRDERGRAEGAIVEVLERRTTQVAGRFSLEGGIGFVTPDNRRISQRVVVPRDACGPARHGDLAVVEITDQPGRNRDPVGRVLRVLPDSGGANSAIELAIASHGLANEFSPEALAIARSYGREVPAAALKGREDLRSTPLVTIDGEDARDFDDAVFAEPSGGGLPAPRRHRGREPLRAAGHGPRYGSARARDLRLLPEPRAAHAARGAFEPSLLADARGRSPLHGLRDAGDRRGRRVEEPLLPGRDALGGALHLHAHRRAPVGRGPACTRQAGAARAGCRLPDARLQGAAQAAREARRARFRGTGGQGAGGRGRQPDGDPRLSP